MKRFAAVTIVAAACAAGLSTDVAAQADTSPGNEFAPIVVQHPGMLCGNMEMD
jgi:hypothetical protein